ncbi:hypothetical protein AVEN_42448-1 [Araneus ventricosus]|uniref:Uncharacterized protein n=1 Tax=Araneus ventricosus TaxID=182803 RepID=A0A4Y1ZWY5_ARAVE|nr:hypothetical protein AVEN_42448-1 [Araneus ventricosus]
MNDRREALKLKLNAMVDTLNSEEEIQAFVKNFASVKPTIDAIRLHNDEIHPLPHNKEIIPVNKKIIPQRRLFSTKKRTSNAAMEVNSNAMKRREEVKNIALQLISKHRSALE